MNKSKILSFTMATVIGATALLGTVSTASASEVTRTQVGTVTQSATKTTQPTVMKQATPSANLELSAQSKQEIEQRNIVAKLAQKGVKLLLQNSDKLIKALPKKYRGPVYKYRNKTLKVLNDLDEWKEGSIITGLIAVGVPPADAKIIASWITMVV